jgi:DNA repair protein RadD
MERNELIELTETKSALILDLEREKTAERTTKRGRALASEIASMEVTIADEYLAKGRKDFAVVNLISAASCFLDANRQIEARRAFEKASAIAEESGLREWVETVMARLPSTLPGTIFQTARPNIESNENLRRPQVEAYTAARTHFNASREHAIVQLPVGCGKTGVMSILPFGISRGRVLAVAPNLEIRRNLSENFDYASEKSFLRRLRVLRNGEGPTCAVLDSEANLHDADDADFVVTNIQQLAAAGVGKWLLKLPPDYFDMIFLDEGHHNVAPTWKRAVERFHDAMVTSFTATPLRSDGQRVEGKRIYRFPIHEAIREGYVKDIASRRLEPLEILFTYKGQKRLHTLEEVMDLREEDWFSKGVALSEECNKNIVDASIQCMRELREGSEFRHQIIASACSIDHAKAIRALYEARSVKAGLLHSKMDEDEQATIRQSLAAGAIDAVIQVQMLGEGADYPTLSVAAIFRPFRHLVPYVQFVGRIMRVLRQNSPRDRENRGFVVSHVGLNVDRWWQDLREIDGDDQLFFEEIANGAREFGDDDSPTQRKRFAPDMTVLNEKIKHLVQEKFLPEDARALVDDLIATMALRGWDIETIGISREDLEQRLLAARREVTDSKPLATLRVSRQQQRKLTRRRLDERVTSAAKQLLNELNLRVTGMQLPLAYPRIGAANNLAAAIILLNREVYHYLHVGAGERRELSLQQLRDAYDNIDNIIDRTAEKVRRSMKRD